MKTYSEFVKYKALSYKWGGRGIDALEGLLDNSNVRRHDGDGSRELSIEDVYPVQNVCAKLPLNLVQKMEHICQVLSISKRAFLEIAINETLASMHEILDEIDVHEFDRLDAEHQHAKDEEQHKLDLEGESAA